MKYKHIIWDYNGTILDDAQMVLDILNSMLKDRDLPTCTIEKYKELFDFPVIEFYKAVGLDFDKYSFALLADEFTKMYEKLFPTCKLRENIVDFIKQLHEKGYKQSILTAGRETHIKAEIANFGLSKYISEITGLHDNKAQSKVHLGEKHLKKIKAMPSEILFIGDTTHDNEVADKIGCDCVLLAGGHQSKDRLMAVNKKIAVELEDIKKYLD